jgi:hypothetical protein
VRKSADVLRAVWASDSAHHRRVRAEPFYAKLGGSTVRVPLDEAIAGANGRDIQFLALDEALESLSKVDPRKGDAG